MGLFLASFAFESPPRRQLLEVALDHNESEPVVFMQNSAVQKEVHAARILALRSAVAARALNQD
jgi:hypothetical protein